MSDEFDWAVGCVECGAIFPVGDEDEARVLYESDVKKESELRRSDDRHTITMLQRSRKWETVTTSAWDGSRDAQEAS